MIPARDQPILLCVCWFARPLTLNKMTYASSLPADRSIVWWRTLSPLLFLASSSSSINQPKLLSIIVASCVRVLDELHMNLACGVKASKILRG